MVVGMKKTRDKTEETMDRKMLKEIAFELKGAGADIKVLKSDTDDVLQRKVNEALQKLPPEDVVKKLEQVDPTKLVTVLKRDCLGLFVDFSDVSCVRCTDASACVKLFVGNLKGMPDLSSAKADQPKEVAKGAPKASPASRYEPDRRVFVRDVPNPKPEGDDYHDTIDRVLEKQPETLKELRALVEQDFELDSDADFMKFVTAMRDPKEGVIKLDVDLTDKDKAALRRAGYEI